MADFVYCVNGQFIPAGEAGVPVGDLGLVRGYGVFDVLRTYARQPFALRRHLERLERSAQQIDLPLPAYHGTIRCSHLFNLLLARGAISVAERAQYIRRIRTLACECAKSFVRGGTPGEAPVEELPADAIRGAS